MKDIMQSHTSGDRVDLSTITASVIVVVDWGAQAVSERDLLTCRNKLLMTLKQKYLLAGLRSHSNHFICVVTATSANIVLIVHWFTLNEFNRIYMSAMKSRMKIRRPSIMCYENYEAPKCFDSAAARLSEEWLPTQVGVFYRCEGERRLIGTRRCWLTRHASYCRSPVFRAHYPHEWELSEHDVLARPWPSSVFSLQWLIRRVLLCGSCHFTHGFIKPVGGCSQAAVRVCVSMHDSVMKYWSVPSSTVRPLPAPFLSLNFILPFRLLSGWRGFILPGVACRSGRQTSSGPMTELIHRSCRMKRPFGVNPFHKASMGSFSQMPVPFCSPDSVRIWWKRTWES